MKTFEIIEILKKELPQCFKPASQKIPLAIGIHEAVLKYYKDDPRFSKTALRHAISQYVFSAAYLKKMVAGAPRINLHGEVQGIVTKQEQSFASNLLLKRSQSKRAIQQQ